MSRQLIRSRLTFHLGLILMLGSAVGSAVTGLAGEYVLPVFTILGAGIALAARIQYRRLQRAARRYDHLIGLGGYSHDLINKPQFTERRHVA